MESPSGPGLRGRVPWLGLLLAVSLLTFWSPPAEAQPRVESVPPNAAEGKDVLLRVHSLPGSLIGYAWYKGESEDSNRKIASYVIDTPIVSHGPAYSGRETIYPNGSLLFQKVTLNDTGNYTVLAIKKGFKSEEGTGQFRVYEPVGKPSIRASNTTVTEHKDTVVLTCLTDDTGISIRWFFSNQSLLLTERMNLSRDNSILTIDPVRREDAGYYQCEVFNPVSSRESDPLRLDVQSEQERTCCSEGAIAGIVIGVLVVVAMGSSLGCFLYLRKTKRASDSSGLRQHPPPASTPGQGPSGTSSFPGPLPGPRTASPIYEELLDINTDVYCRINPRADGAS